MLKQLIHMHYFSMKRIMKLIFISIALQFITTLTPSNLKTLYIKLL